jgi:UDP-glucose:(heptosyl)LPS alpha-1,3-glucosyltransferase
MDVPADFYFAADDCQADVLARRHCSLMLKLHPRYRTFLKQEKALFTAEDGPAVWYIAPQQKTAFRKCYGTPEERFRYLPPGMNPACRRPEESKVREIRDAKRRELGLAPDEIAVILVAAQFHLKGGDRLLQGIAALPEELRRRIRLIWAGNGSDSLCRRMARRLNLVEQLKVLGGRNDVPELLLASDIMIHPARFESAGSVLIEAIAAGVPVIATATCGFAYFVAEIHGKLVLKEPFCQEELNEAMVQALQMLPELTEKTIDYASRTDFCSRAARAVDMLEEERKS